MKQFTSHFLFQNSFYISQFNYLEFNIVYPFVMFTVFISHIYEGTRDTFMKAFKSTERCDHHTANDAIRVIQSIYLFTGH